MLMAATRMKTQVQAALNQLNRAKNDLNGDNKVAQAKETAKTCISFI
ncbi:hypothetical protein UM590_03490 [Staphylococcus aureus]|nr:hypothetical protein UM590_03490 [Staphylococcus aureus]